jgi:hypothetical protein
MFLKGYLKETKFLKTYIISIISVIVLSYSIYLFCNDDAVEWLGDEDGFFESLTALFFLISAVLFFCCFLRTKNIFLFGLALLMFVGAGEEISWGQRIFNFSTPEAVNKTNVQHEFNIHNLEVFNDRNLEGVKKTGMQRLFEINILYRIFSIGFLTVVPIFFFYFRPVLFKGKKMQMPVAPFSIGIFFFISWLLFYALKYYVLPGGRSRWYYLTSGEIFEFTAAFIYFLVALYFYRDKDNNYLGKDIKHVIS